MGRTLREALAVAAGAMAASPSLAAPPAPPPTSIAEAQAALASGRTTSVALVKAYEARIAALNPRLHAVIAVNPDALNAAAKLDAERRAGRVRGPLHGVPILVKDNVETADPLPTTAGSLALKDNRAGRDAPLVARLKAAGAIVLGKTNLSEWANIRSSYSVSGWSAVGGLTRNPYALDRNSCGSSSGSGSAVAAGLAPAAIGSETDGSINCPSAVQGLVGIKPTLGLVPRTGVVPISHWQDTAGPMATTVADAAALLTVLAGSDAADAQSAEADRHRGDYTKALDPGALRGKRLGVLRFAAGFDPKVDAVFDRALAALRAAGAELVEIKEPGVDLGALGKAEDTALTAELKSDLNAYLAKTPPAVKTRTLADVIAFNRAHARAELALFGQDKFEAAEKTAGGDAPEAVKARETARRLAGPDGVDRLLRDNRVDALIAPTYGAAWMTDWVTGDHTGGGTAVSLAAVSGDPSLTVPMGDVAGLPLGLIFVGPAWSEARLIGLAYAFEQATHARRPPTLQATVPLP